MREIAAALLLVAAPVAVADVPEPLDRLSVAIGGYYPTVDSAVTANSASVKGTTVNFQKDLNLDNHRTLPTGRIDFLVFDNQGFSISGYQYSRSAGTMLSRDVEFDGDHFQVGADIMAHLRIEVLTGAWHWWFTPTAQDVLGFGLGAVYYDVHGSIGGTLSVANASISGSGAAGDDVLAPLATFAWRHAFSHDMRAYAELSGVWKDGGNIRGHQANGIVGMDYFPWRNLGFALEYDANDLTLKSDRNTWDGKAQIKFYGPAAFVRARF
jgi:hypothetical protein